MVSREAPTDRIAADRLLAYVLTRRWTRPHGSVVRTVRRLPAIAKGPKMDATIGFKPPHQPPCAHAQHALPARHVALLPRCRPWRIVTGCPALSASFGAPFCFAGADHAGGLPGDAPVLRRDRDHLPADMAAFAATVLHDQIGESAQQGVKLLLWPSRQRQAGEVGRICSSFRRQHACGRPMLRPMQ